MKKRIWMLVTGAVLTASVLGGIPREISENEDVRFIMKWQREHRLEAGARALDLSQEQVAALLEMKAAVTAVRTEYEPDRTALQEKFVTAAAEIRSRIEATDTLSEGDKQLMASLRKEGRQLAREMRLKVQMATLGLAEVLTPEQRQTVRQWATDRGKRNRFAGKGMGGRARSHHGTRAGGLGFLLSDSFLNQYATR